MDIERIFNKVLIRSGQFLMDTNGIELHEDRFRVLVEDALTTYSRFSPYDEHVHIQATGGRRVKLTPELIRSLTGKDFLSTPDWISDAAPSRAYGINPYFIFRNLDPTNNPDLIDKTQMPWTYRKPDIYFPISADWDVHCVWRHRIIEERTEIGGFRYSVPTLDEYDSEKFIKLVQALFLQGIGRSRRAFTMSDLPIIMDGGEIAGEGVQMEQDAIEDLENIQKFYLAW